MGIRGFGKWLRTRYPSAFRPLQPQSQSYDYLYVDMNSLLHCVARNARTEASLHSQTKRYLRDLHRRFGPRRKMFLAIDGPASLVKIEEQRKRRRDCSLVAQRTGLLDAQQFTPGCTLMGRLEAMLTKFPSELLAEKRKERLEFILSGSNVPGEGETKIFHALSEWRSRGGTHAIVTTDSDAFLHTVGYAIPQVFIVPPPWDFGKNQDIMMADTLIRLLREEAAVTRATSMTEQERNQKQVILDFCFLASLSGNDYLPSMQFGNYSLLWPLYCHHPDIRLIDPQTGFIRLLDFQRLLKNWYESDLFIAHRGLQQKLLETAALADSTETHHRIVQFLAGALALTHNTCGQTKSSTLNIHYGYVSAPSIGELIHLMDIDKVQTSLRLALIESEKAGPQLCPLSAAILLLEPNERSLIYLPEHIRPLARQYTNLMKEQKFKDNLAALKWLTQEIVKLKQNEMLFEKGEIDKSYGPISHWIFPKNSQAYHSNSIC